jgi:hypothetical protein
MKRRPARAGHLWIVTRQCLRDFDPIVVPAYQLMIRVFSVPRAIQQRNGNLHLRCQIHRHYRRVFHRPTEGVIPQGFERDAAAAIRCEPSVLIDDKDAVMGHSMFL